MRIKQTKSPTFDLAKIKRQVQTANVKLLMKFGAFTRQRMKSSLKYKKGTSGKGEVPFVHKTGGFTRLKTTTNRKTKEKTTSRQSVSPLRELIFFAVSDDKESVVTGPLLFGSGGAKALEHGGPATVKRKGKVKRVMISAHPFAEPAGRLEAANVKELLRNFIN